jgi:hypothetical protein
MGDVLNSIAVWAVDVGSVRKNNLGWCRIRGEERATGQDIRRLVQGIASDLTDALPVALGFECPLFVPVPEDPVLLTSARPGEGSRSWSANAGAGALATGLTECVWILEQIRRMSISSITPTLDWGRFLAGQANLFLWEAFVTSLAKSLSHHGDAEIAAMSFCGEFPQIAEASSVTAANPYSLIGAALLRAGLTADLSVLSIPCVVIRS